MPRSDDIKVVLDFSEMTLRIEDYALIGDCEAAALVGRDGSIDWLCWPRFDSDACFAALLGTPDNGRFRIAPVGEARVTRRYRDNTLILETSFETDDEPRPSLISCRSGPGRPTRPTLYGSCAAIAAGCECAPS